LYPLAFNLCTPYLSAAVVVAELLRQRLLLVGVALVVWLKVGLMLTQRALSETVVLPRRRGAILSFLL
jgi:hypothetical protein